MRRLAACLILLSALPAWSAAAPAKASAVPLEVIGDTVTVVKSLPFTLRAKEGADFYFWTYPDSIKATPIDNELKVTSAPKGTFRASVLAVTIDFKDGKKVVTKERQEVEVNVGDVPGPGPGPDPKPPPDPSSPLAKALKAAFLAETDADKEAQTKALAVIFTMGAKLVGDGSKKTLGALDKAIQLGADEGKVAGRLKGMQSIISAHMKDRGVSIVKNSSVPIDDTNRDKIMGALTEVALALKEVSP